MAELTIKEARKIYSSSDSLKDLMLSKFKKAKLEHHEVSQDEFDKKFLELLDRCTKTVFIDEHGNISKLPTNRIELRNKDDEWMFDIQFTGENKHFWASTLRILGILEEEYGLQVADIQRLMKNQMKIRFNLTDITLGYTAHRGARQMKIRFNLT
jgi:hypothetical protein